MKNNKCFDCLNHTKGELAENNGWYHPCKFELKNEGLQDIKRCEKYLPNTGFQIGGYYSHIHFEISEENELEPCMEMIIHSDGQFPTDDPSKQIQLHICNFKQLEHFVIEWGQYFREHGIITND